MAALRYAHDNGKPLPPPKDLRLNIVSFETAAHGGWSPLDCFSLTICDYEIHDNAPMFPNEPPVPCTGADKPFKLVLELTNAAGEKVTPPRGFKVKATLHIEGSHSELTADEVMWAQRGSAPPRRKAVSYTHLTLPTILLV